MVAGWMESAAWTPLPASTIDVWRIGLVQGGADRTLLSDDERARAERLVVEVKRAQFVAGRLALRHILARYVSAPAGDLVFAYSEHGKPSLTAEAAPAFNLSHSHELALVGVWPRGRIGVDVEHHRPDRRFERIAARFFAPSEHRALVAFPESEQLGVFYRTWTRKEAYLKACATGLSFASNRFAVGDGPDGRATIVSTEMPGDDSGAWHFEDLEVAPAYSASVCWEGETAAVRLFGFEH